MAVIYEVTVHIRADLAGVFLAWLRAHVAEIVALPGFESAEIHTVLDESGNERSWCIRYRLRDRQSLDDYLRDHAPRMRADGVSHFGDALRAERRLLAPLES